MAQIIPIVPESLQKKIRDLLPSQQGFGEDLQASNVILPILDVTSAASGADVGQNLQTAGILRLATIKLRTQPQQLSIIPVFGSVILYIAMKTSLITLYQR